MKKYSVTCKVFSIFRTKGYFSFFFSSTELLPRIQYWISIPPADQDIEQKVGKPDHIDNSSVLVKSEQEEVF